ncbi:MAG: 30S ribosomal protein S8 [Bdellovibrionales bacterium CG10_big_fil_rev_8_21_14_0_10_45_34]|nr:MAG: 30S ribosomal protein S8 [Bdellovibrionales bacterium CG10_big_fil_rev_8_21_14_0_10_45_34]
MDTISEFLTRVRNAQAAGHPKVDIPSSNMRSSIAHILKAEGFIRDFKVAKDGRQGMMRVYLKFAASGRPVINSLKRVSRPGRRVYVKSDEIPKVQSGFGVTVLSTNKGLVTGAQAEKEKLGGELLFKVY